MLLKRGEVPDRPRLDGREQANARQLLLHGDSTGETCPFNRLGLQQRRHRDITVQHIDDLLAYDGGTDILTILDTSDLH